MKAISSEGGKELIESDKHTSLLCCRSNWDKSAVWFGRQVVAWLLDMFCKFYSVKNYNITTKSITN